MFFFPSTNDVVSVEEIFVGRHHRFPNRTSLTTRRFRPSDETIRLVSSSNFRNSVDLSAGETVEGRFPCW